MKISMEGSTDHSDRGINRRIVYALILIAIYAALLIVYLLIKSPSLDLTRFTLERQSKSFLLVSTLKSSLGIIEGSDVGFGFRLQVGDIVQSTYDLVDFTWKMLLYGILMITFSKIFHESNLIDVGTYILAAGFIIRIFSLFIRAHRERFVSLGSGIIIAGLIVSFYIPVSTFVSFRACEYFVDHIERDMNEQMEAVLKDWETFKSEISLRKLKNSIQSAGEFTKSLFLRLTRILVTFTVLVIIRYLLFPLIVGYGFFIVSKAFVKKKFE
ncbi:MAG: hypothetical protein JRH18_13560 [Deltaproteobacteria bacterium]|nr:hypothetical protein [Deltaproteobacteria bacterium]MBW1994499.1 hypothetical protein [Deltaproteobacteria bacterium]MBW2152682.1 hypothetical protein [Deltaproteobacteria bacterium]